MTIGLLAHLYVGDRILAVLKVLNFRGRIFRRVVNQRNWNHCGQPACVAADIEQIESDLSATALVDVGWPMPGIDGRTECGRLPLISGMNDQVVELLLRTGGSQVQFANRVPKAVAAIG